MTDRYSAAVLGIGTAAEPTRAVHIYGPASEREESARHARENSPHLPIVHHRRPWVRLVNREIAPRLERAPMSRSDKWANLTFLAACAFVIAVIVWNVATS